MDIGVPHCPLWYMDAVYCAVESTCILLLRIPRWPRLSGVASYIRRGAHPCAMSHFHTRAPKSTFKFGHPKSLPSSRFIFLLILIPHVPQLVVCWCYRERLVAAAPVSLQVAKKQEKMGPRKHDTTRLDMHTYITLAHAQFHVPASEIEAKKTFDLVGSTSHIEPDDRGHGGSHPCIALTSLHNYNIIKGRIHAGSNRELASAPFTTTNVPIIGPHALAT